MEAARTIGRYRILFDLAEGGMGVVSAAELIGDRGFRRTVAIKRIHPHLARDPKFHEQFVQEAQLASRITDPGVVQVYELVEEQGELLLAMELVAGVSLRKLLSATPTGMRLPAPVVAGIVASAARALSAAHVATDDQGRPLGLVHRDVTPENVLLSFRGEVKLTDFGVAKAVSRDSAHSEAVRGKPPYFSPEQARGELLDPRSDVWSLGVVAYEMLSGKQPFRGRNDLEAIQRVLHEAVPPLENVPEPIAAALSRCLERDRDARWQTALGLAEAIEAAVPNAESRGRAALAAPIARWLPGEEKRFEKRLRQARAALLSGEAPPARARQDDVTPPLDAAAAGSEPRRSGIARPALLSVVGFTLAFAASWWIDGAPTRFEAAPVAAEPAAIAQPTPGVTESGRDLEVTEVDGEATGEAAIAESPGSESESEATGGAAQGIVTDGDRAGESASTEEESGPRTSLRERTRRPARPRMQRPRPSSMDDPGFAEHFPL